MTEREKELFSNIFKTLLTRKVKEDEYEEDTLSFGQHSQSGEHARPSSKSERTSAVDVPVSLAEDYLQAYPPSIQREATQALTYVQQAQARTDARQEAIEARRSPRYLEAREALLACRTLAELYQFLEDKLFRPFARQEVTLKDMSTKDKSDLSEFCRSYPMLLAETMTILRLSYRDYSAAIGVFQRIRDLGVESEVIGTNIAVYNELLLATFEGWHDASLVDDVLAAMDADGIQADDHTILILKKITDTIMGERAGSKSAQVYWSLTSPRKLESLSKRLRGLSRNVPTGKSRFLD